MSDSDPRMAGVYLISTVHEFPATKVGPTHVPVPPGAAPPIKSKGLPPPIPLKIIAVASVAPILVRVNVKSLEVPIGTSSKSYGFTSLNAKRAADCPVP